MDDVVLLEGETYISSKRASEISGYARDHIGYLARRGEVEARQIGGLWYILQRSLEEYQKRIKESVPATPSAAARKADPETIVSFDGKDYISVQRAADLTGYHQDYVGQLARSAKILSRQIGKRWYIERESLLAHKSEKDSLLAAVQSESVGLHRHTPAERAKSTEDQGGPYMTYSSDSGDLMPLIQTGREMPQDIESRIAEMPISSHISDMRSVPIRSEPTVARRSTTRARRAVARRTLHLTTALATIVIVIAVGYVSVQNSALYTGVVDSEAGLALVEGASGQFSSFLDLVERVISPEIHYSRAQ